MVQLSLSPLPIMVTVTETLPFEIYFSGSFPKGISQALVSWQGHQVVVTLSGPSVGYREPGKIQRHSLPRGKGLGGEDGKEKYASFASFWILTVVQLWEFLQPLPRLARLSLTKRNTLKMIFSDKWDLPSWVCSRAGRTQSWILAWKSTEALCLWVEARAAVWNDHPQPRPLQS